LISLNARGLAWARIAVSLEDAHMTFRAVCLAAVLSLGACAPLTAHAPLFSLADQANPPPLREGVWMQSDPECTAEAAQAGEDGCVRIEVSRRDDGVWLYTMRSTDENGMTEENAWRFVIASAVETQRGDAYAPLYVAEYVAIDEPDQPFYAVVAPVGLMPASEVRMVAMIDCDDALREGPIPGVEEQVGEEAFERLCMAASRGAVREAARRALVENLPVLLGEERARFIWIAPFEEARPRQMVAAQ
jgi:hypothetical protein